MDKSLQELFRAADSGIGNVAGTGVMNDFRPKSLGKLSSFPGLELVEETGSITFGSLVEDGETVSVATYAKAISCSLQLLVNDSLGAVERSIRDIAFAAVNLKANLLLTALLTAQMRDGKTLFHADHNNVLSGPGVGLAPSVAALGEMRKKMRLQKALDNSTVLGLGVGKILVPAALETVAQGVAATISAARSEDVNPFSGVQVFCEPRLDAIDDAAWFGFDGIMPAIEFDTLEGTPTPRLEIADPADFNRLGSAYRVWWACGAAPIEHRAAVRNAGATGDTE
jgi:hypothetical protein